MAKRIEFDWNKIDVNLAKAASPAKNFKELDARYYQPKFKEDGTFEALIRFLPGKDNDGLPFVNLRTHGFKVNGKWFIENCPYSIGITNCPACQHAKTFWDAGDKDMGSDRGSKKNYHCNIYIVNDPQTPANNGKVFLYRHGQMIQNMIMLARKPAEGSIDKPVNIYDPYEGGANFKLKIYSRKVGEKSQPQYDRCGFESPSAVASDEKVAEILDQRYPLEPIIAPSEFLSCDELKLKLEKVLLFNSSPFVNDAPSTIKHAEDTKSEPAKVVEQVVKPAAPAVQAPKREEVVIPNIKIEDGDDDGFLARLRVGN